MNALNRINELKARKDEMYSNAYRNANSKNYSPTIVDDITAELKAIDDELKKLEATYHPLDDANVGDGVTYTIWTDRHAGTIISRTDKSITMQRDHATLVNGPTSDENDRLRCDVGGFVAHVSGIQRWRYERDLNGRVDKFTRREIKDRSTGEVIRIAWKLSGTSTRSQGNTLQAGRNEHYDYNF